MHKKLDKYFYALGTSGLNSPRYIVISTNVIFAYIHILIRQLVGNFMKKPIIGIDLGTTNSLLAIFEDGAPRILANSLGKLLTPSVVAVRNYGLLVGQAAWDIAASEPQMAAAAFKRKMGANAKIRLGPYDLTAPELSSLVLKKLKFDAETELGTEITDVVVSVPAYFNQIQREATQTACLLAGLTPLQLINEPTAAALAYGLNDREGESQFMIFDLGGGTFDVTVLEHYDGVMEVKASSGDAYLGGEDFTRIIQSMLADDIGKELDILSIEDQNRLLYFAEKAKQQLSSDEAFEFKFSLASSEEEFKACLSPEAFEAAAGALIKRMRRPIHACLYDNDGNRRDIDRVILVGGATRMPLAKRLAAREAHLFPDATINPDHAVVIGAAIQAALIAEDKALDDVVMTDVSPFSVGVGSSWEGVSGKRISDLFVPIIERNTPLPASRSERFRTTADNQTRMCIDVYQGEAAHVHDNIALGEFNVCIPRNKAGKEAVDVRVTYDVSGLIEIEAKCDSTGVKNTMIVETNTSKLDDVEIKQKIASLAHLKVHPKDDEANLALLSRLNRLFEMTMSDNREEIMHMMVDFQSVLEKQDPKLIKVQRDELSKQLDMIDRFYVS
ncbi:Hsp70 family protein [Pseudovibrio ascidiaceicola]|uniref:Hsp70 family protein n=1 Tax=Pseudovibrio ascidiaceicola TaxID=285279 RepID=UPI003D367142